MLIIVYGLVISCIMTYDLSCSTLCFAIICCDMTTDCITLYNGALCNVMLRYIASYIVPSDLILCCVVSYYLVLEWYYLG